MGFMTMPASQDLSPHSCASAMAPRSQSCHAVGASDSSLESEDYSDTQSQHGARYPPVKPKRHPSTRLSTSSTDGRDGRGAPEAAPPLHPHTMKKSDSGELCSKKVPPLKPKRSPSTQLTFDGADSQVQTDGDEEPVYIEMVGQVFTRESQTVTPHPVTPVATTPDSDSDQSEAIYEEMKYPQQENREISHSLPLPSSASSTPVPQVLSASPHTPRAPTPYLLPGSKSESESSTKIPAPFPNLLQHRPPLLAFPQPAAASSGVQSKSSSSAKTQTSNATTQASTSSSTSNVPLSGSKESSSSSDKHNRDSQLGPAPGLRARSHSTPLPQGQRRRPTVLTFRHYLFIQSNAPEQYQLHPYASVLIPASSLSPASPLTHIPRPASIQAPSSDSPLLWTYPSGGFRRPPAYESHRASSQTPSLQHPSSLIGLGEGPSKSNGGSSSLNSKAGFLPWDSSASLGADEGSYWPMQRKLSFSHGSRDSESRAWNGSADALLRMDKEELGSRGGHSNIPVHFGGRALGHSESLAGVDSSLGFRALPRASLPLPCQTFPACRNGGMMGRLGRSSSAAGVRQVGGDVPRQSSLPTRDTLNLTQRDGKLLEVIERKRCLCKEIKAHRRPDKSLCKQDSMPILPSWRRTPEPRKTGTPPCQRPQAVVWDTAI
uniref:Neuronal tyrosine phosphorylated phosphoinositide-3-kinase adaptor 1 n=1 Tax=Neogobius melanostomus TaxID=47308 RepID=A0A8C6TA34_9GOBI